MAMLVRVFRHVLLDQSQLYSVCDAIETTGLHFQPLYGSLANIVRSLSSAHNHSPALCAETCTHRIAVG